jgi:hypothetical protein
MDATAAALARRVADAAAAWLDEPRDTEAFRRLVAATDRYRDHANPPLPLEVLDLAAELVVLARSGQVGDLLDGTPREVIARLRARLELDQPTESPQPPDATPSPATPSPPATL